MAITTAVANQYKLDCINGVHQPGDVYKLALYTSSATLDKTTTAYTATNEVAGTGYTAGGVTLTGRTAALSGDTACVTWSDVAIPSASISAAGCMIYNATRANACLGVFSFGGIVTSTNATYTIDLPAAGVSATLRFE